MASQLGSLIERLGLESARREAILTSMVEGVLAVDQDLRITFYNASFARTFGLRAEIPERTLLVEVVRDPVLREILSRVLATGETLKQRLQLPAAEGRAFEVQAAPLQVTGGRGAIAILHDISDLERLERVRKDFVANVSHELRTPLTAIRGYTETLLEGALEDQENNRKFLEIIKSSLHPLEYPCLRPSGPVRTGVRQGHAGAGARFGPGGYRSRLADRGSRRRAAAALNSFAAVLRMWRFLAIGSPSSRRW